MARSQFTFTFRNAEPGAAVTFSAAVYSSPADQVADGPALALDAARTVAVWSDASELSATWVDGAGTSITAEASLDRPVVVETGGVAGASPAATGGSSAVTPIALTLAWDNPDLLTGVAWFTAAVDSRLGYAQYPLIDVSTSEDWNGTGPEFHLCTITGGVATLLDSLVSAQSPLLDSAAVGGVGAAGMAFTGPQGLIDVPAGTVFGVVVDDSAGGATGGTAGRSVLKSLLWVAATPT